MNRRMAAAHADGDSRWQKGAFKNRLDRAGIEALTPCGAGSCAS